jgi:hypothetical protein
MTTTVLTPATPRPTPTATVEHAPRPLVGWAARDALTTAWRTLLGAVRTPQILLFALVQPVMFVLLFRYVFGGAIDVPGGSYVDYLMPASSCRPRSSPGSPPASGWPRTSAGAWSTGSAACRWPPAPC